jgi:plastocyanin
MKRFGSPVVPALAALGLALAACATTTTTAEPAPAESVAAPPSAAASASVAPEAGDTVQLIGSAFEPAELTVAAGTEVTFMNADSTAHTVTEGTNGTAVEDPIIDEDLAPDASTSFTFDEPGTYEITCRIHPSMQLTITVEG